MSEVFGLMQSKKACNLKEKKKKTYGGIYICVEMPEFRRGKNGVTAEAVGMRILWLYRADHGR